MCIPTAGQVPASKSHKSRRWSFLPAADATSPSLGTLTVCQGRGDVESYGVAMEAGQVLLLKLSDGEVYGVDVPFGRPVRCSCKGFGFARTCKHLDAVRGLLADGVLPAAPVEPPRPSTADLQGGF